MAPQYPRSSEKHSTNISAPAKCPSTGAVDLADRLLNSADQLKHLRVVVIRTQSVRRSPTPPAIHRLPSLDDQSMRALAALYEQGASVSNLITEFGITRKTLYEHLKRTRRAVTSVDSPDE